MEKVMQRENVHVGYGKSPRSSDSGEMDFNDVFGGPPRRFSMQEVRSRYSFGEPEEETPSSPWKEKPVFGEERRRKGADFFDDIFKGVDRDRDCVFGSNPSSRIMSPIADHLSTSLPAPAFSLPARLSKGMDLPTFGSHNHGGSNGYSSPQSRGALSRFSNEAARSMDESNRNEVDREIPLFNESEKETRNFSIGNQFHFSIYKWAGKGLMPLVIENNLKSKDQLKSESSNGSVERKSSPIRKGVSVTSKEEQNYIQIQESKPEIIPSDVKEEQAKSFDESNVGERVEKQVPATMKIREDLKSEFKPLHAFLVGGETKDVHDSNRVQVNGRKVVTQGESAAIKGKVKDFVQIFNKETVAEGTLNSRRGNVVIDNKGINDVRSNPEKIKQEVKQNNVDKKPDDPIEVVENLKKKGINEVSSNPEKVKLEVKQNSADKKPEVPFKVVENLNNEAQQEFFMSRRTTTRSFSTLRRSFSAGAQYQKDLLSPEIDDPLEDNFVVQELSDINETPTENENSEDTKAIDAKIRQWSDGKKGNIRSLLSTLQYVLWAESGWKAVPLVDLIEANAVKRAYQKALLRLHPDKLQQKGASFEHKYTAEKVFDILQEAWDHFNTCSSLGV